MEQHPDVSVQPRAVDQPDDEQIRDRIVGWIAVPAESNVSVEPTTAFASALVDGEPEVLAVALADEHHSADPDRQTIKDNLGGSTGLVVKGRD